MLQLFYHKNIMFVRETRKAIGLKSLPKLFGYYSGNVKMRNVNYC